MKDCCLTTHTHTHIYIYIYIYTHTQQPFCTKFSEWSLTGYHTKVKEPCLSYYLLTTEERIVGFIAFPRVLSPCEM